MVSRTYEEVDEYLTLWYYLRTTNQFCYKLTLIEDIRNFWLYCFTNPLELGTRVLVQFEHMDDAKAKHISQVQGDL